VSESDTIDAVDRPATVASLTDDLRQLGVHEGEVVIVHSSLSRLGWVAGGAQAVVQALMTVVGPTGTVAMPTHTAHLTDPARWTNPPVPADWVATIRAEMPAFDRALTPTREMGEVVECFRHHSRSLRSDHPTESFAANGPMASRIIDHHPLTPAMGEGSPLHHLYDLDASVLLLGVDHANNTSLHLAEYRSSWPSKHTYTEGVPMMVDGGRQWVQFEDLAIDADDFATIGDAFAATGRERQGPVGAGVGRHFSMRTVVDFAVDWMSTHRR
jgi:aminoglycoside 3-N-acetyltransferase